MSAFLAVQFEVESYQTHEGMIHCQHGADLSRQIQCVKMNGVSSSQGDLGEGNLSRLNEWEIPSGLAVKLDVIGMGGMYKLGGVSVEAFLEEAAVVLLALVFLADDFSIEDDVSW